MPRNAHRRAVKGLARRSGYRWTGGIFGASDFERELPFPAKHKILGMALLNTLVVEIQAVVSGTQSIGGLMRAVTGLGGAARAMDGAWRDANGRLHDAQGRFAAAGNAANQAGGQFRGLGLSLGGVNAQLPGIATGFGTVNASMLNLSSGINVVQQAVAGVQQLMQGMKGMADEANKAATDTRVFDLTMRRFAVSAEEANATAQRLADRFGMAVNDVQGSMTTLVRVGFRDMGQLEKMMTGAAASSIAFGRSAGDGFDRLADAATTGLSAALNAIGISENLGPAYDQFARSVGTTAENLTEAQKSQVLFNLVTKATETEVGALDSVLNDYVKSQQLADLAQKNLTRSMGEIFMPIVARYNILLGSAAGVLADLVKGIRAGADPLDVLAAKFPKLAGTIDQLRPILGQAQGYFDAFKIVAGQAFDSLLPIITKAVTQLGPVFARLMPVLSDMATRAGQVFQTVLLPAFQRLQAQAGPILERVGAFLLNMGEQAQDTLQNVIVPALQGLAPHLQDLWGKVQATLPKLLPIFQDIGNTAKQIFDNVLVPAFRTLAPIVEQVVGRIIELLPTLARTFRDGFQAVADLGQNVLLPALNWIAPTVSYVVDRAGDVLKNLLVAVKNIFGAIAALIRGDWKGVWESLKNAVGHALLAVENTLKGAVTLIGKILGGLNDVIDNKAKDLAEKIKSAGRKLADRFVEGFSNIKAGIQAKVADALQMAFSKVPEAVKEFLKQHLNIDLNGMLEDVRNATDAAKPKGPQIGPQPYVPGSSSAYGEQIVRASMEKRYDKEADEIVDRCVRWVRDTLGDATPKMRAAIDQLFKGAGMGYGDPKNWDAHDATAGFKKAGLYREYKGIQDLKRGDTVLYTDGGQNHAGIYLGNGVVRGNNRVTFMENGGRIGKNGLPINDGKFHDPVGNVDINKLGKVTGYVAATELADYLKIQGGSAAVSAPAPSGKGGSTSLPTGKGGITGDLPLVQQIAMLDPKFRTAIQNLLHGFNDPKNGLIPVITSGYRSIAEQNRLWQIGRDKNGKVVGDVVTNAKGGQSMHNYGLAVDIWWKDPKTGKTLSYSDIRALDASKALGTYAASKGLDWGGNWDKFKDRPHFEAPISWKQAQAGVRPTYDKLGVTGPTPVDPKTGTPAVAKGLSEAQKQAQAFIKQLDTAKKIFDKIGRDAPNYDKAAANYAKTLTQVAAQADKLLKNPRLTREEKEAFQGVSGAAKQRLEDLKKASDPVDFLNTKLEQARTRLNLATEGTKEYTAAQKAQKKVLEEYIAAAQKQAATLKPSDPRLKTLGDGVKNARAELKALNDAMKNGAGMEAFRAKQAEILQGAVQTAQAAEKAQQTAYAKALKAAGNNADKQVEVVRKQGAALLEARRNAANQQFALASRNAEVQLHQDMAAAAKLNGQARKNAEDAARLKYGNAMQAAKQAATDAKRTAQATYEGELEAAKKGAAQNAEEVLALKKQRNIALLQEEARQADVTQQARERDYRLAVEQANGQADRLAQVEKNQGERVKQARIATAAAVRKVTEAQADEDYRLAMLAAAKKSGDERRALEQKAREDKATAYRAAKDTYEAAATAARDGQASANRQAERGLREYQLEQERATAQHSQRMRGLTVEQLQNELNATEQARAIALNDAKDDKERQLQIEIEMGGKILAAQKRLRAQQRDNDAAALRSNADLAKKDALARYGGDVKNKDYQLAAQRIDQELAGELGVLRGKYDNDIAKLEQDARNRIRDLKEGVQAELTLTAEELQKTIDGVVKDTLDKTDALFRSGTGFEEQARNRGAAMDILAGSMREMLGVGAEVSNEQLANLSDNIDAIMAAGGDWNPQAWDGLLELSRQLNAMQGNDKQFLPVEEAKQFAEAMERAGASSQDVLEVLDPNKTSAKNRSLFANGMYALQGGTNVSDADRTDQLSQVLGKLNKQNLDGNPALKALAQRIGAKLTEITNRGLETAFQASMQQLNFDLSDLERQKDTMDPETYVQLRRDILTRIENDQWEHDRVRMVNEGKTNDEIEVARQAHLHRLGEITADAGTQLIEAERTRRLQAEDAAAKLSQTSLENRKKQGLVSELEYVQESGAIRLAELQRQYEREAYEARGNLNKLAQLWQQFQADKKALELDTAEQTKALRIRITRETEDALTRIQMSELEHRHEAGLISEEQYLNDVAAAKIAAAQTAYDRAVQDATKEVDTPLGKTAVIDQDAVDKAQTELTTATLEATNQRDLAVARLHLNNARTLWDAEQALAAGQLEAQKTQGMLSEREYQAAKEQAATLAAHERYRRAVEDAKGNADLEKAAALQLQADLTQIFAQGTADRKKIDDDEAARQKAENEQTRAEAFRQWDHNIADAQRRFKQSYGLDGQADLVENLQQKYEALSEIMSSGTQTTEEYEATLRQLLETEDALKDAKALPNMVSTWQGALQQLGKDFEERRITAEQFSDGLKQIKPKLYEMADAAEKAGDLKTAYAFREMAKGLRLMEPATANLIAKLGKVQEFVDGFSQIAGAFSKLAGAMGEAEQEYDSVTGEKLQTPWKDAAANIDGAINAATTLLDIGKDIVSGNWVGAIAKIVSSIADAVSGFQKAKAEVRRLKEEFAADNPLLNAGDYQKAYTRSRGWLADVFGGGPEVVNEIDKIGLKYAQSIAGGISSGITAGIDAARETGSYEEYVKAFQASLADGIRQSMVTAFMDDPQRKEAYASLIKEYTDALKAGDPQRIAAARQGLSQAYQRDAEDTKALLAELDRIDKELGQGKYSPEAIAQREREMAQTANSIAEQALEVRYTKGLISTEEYEKQRLELTLNRIRLEMAAALAAQGLTAEQIAQIQAQYDLQMQQAQAEYDRNRIARKKEMLLALSELERSNEEALLEYRFTAGLVSEQEYNQARLKLTLARIQAELEAELEKLKQEEASAEMIEAVREKYRLQGLAAQAAYNKQLADAAKEQREQEARDRESMLSSWRQSLLGGVQAVLEGNSPLQALYDGVRSRIAQAIQDGFIVKRIISRMDPLFAQLDAALQNGTDPTAIIAKVGAALPALGVEMQTSLAPILAALNSSIPNLTNAVNNNTKALNEMEFQQTTIVSYNRPESQPSLRKQLAGMY